MSVLGQLRHSDRPLGHEKTFGASVGTSQTCQQRSSVSRHPPATSIQAYKVSTEREAVQLSRLTLRSARRNPFD
jgi:hypothetical protein